LIAVAFGIVFGLGLLTAPKLNFNELDATIPSGP
jgi:hypothetical protein